MHITFFAFIPPCFLINYPQLLDDETSYTTIKLVRVMVRVAFEVRERARVVLGVRIRNRVLFFSENFCHYEKSVSESVLSHIGAIWNQI